MSRIMEKSEQVLEHHNFNISEIITPVNPDVLKTLLTQSNYEQSKIDYLVKGFREGFSLGYEGPK